MSRMGKTLYLIAGLSVVAFLVARFILEGFVPALWLPLGLFVACLIGAVWVDRRLYFDFLTMKTTKHGMNMGAMILSVLAMLGAVNFVSIRHYKTFDFSLSQRNTLSDQSIRLLQSLDQELKITFFYKDGVEGARQNRQAFQTLVKNYQDVSSKVSLDFVEVNKRPDLAEQYGVNKGDGVIFVEYKGRKNRIEKIDEQEITGAIAKAVREKEKVVYLVTGHGEGSLDESKDASGLAALKRLLEGNRYQVRALPLAMRPEIPKDADLVLIVGPKQAFLEIEVKTLEKYMQDGGSLFVALDPSMDHGLSPLLEKVGVKLANNYVVTVMQGLGAVVDPSVTPVSEFSSTNNITKVFGSNGFVLFRMPQALEKGAVPSGVAYDEIVRTGDNSYSFPDSRFEGDGKKGPFTLAAFIKGRWPGGTKDFQAVVVGDSDFLDNQLLYRNLNRDLLLNAVVTLAKEENMVSITPKEVSATEMNLTDNRFYIFIFAFVIPLPLLMLISSGVLWFRRRNA